MLGGPFPWATRVGLDTVFRFKRWMAPPEPDLRNRTEMTLWRKGMPATSLVGRAGSASGQQRSSSLPRRETNAYLQVGAIPAASADACEATRSWP
jgi:hypothetical protein